MSIQESVQSQHFDSKGKLPSTVTVELQNGLRKTLPFEDQRDFEESQKGFIAAPLYKQIMADAGNVAWDMGSYDFLLQSFDSVFDSIHPSLQRQAVLNMAYGLYEVLPDKIYQVRGFDLATMTIIKGNTGWILFDVLTCKETARAALELVNEHLGQKESPSVRNSFLAAAYELRNGFSSGVTAKSVTPDTVRAMSTELLLDFIAIRVDSQKAAGMKFTINLVTPDNGEQFAVEMSNSTLTNIKGFQANNPDLTITINRSDLELIMAGLSTFPTLFGEGKVKLEGNPAVFEQLKIVLVEFTPDFDIMPGTCSAKAETAPEKDVFEQPQPANTSGG